MSPSCNTRSCHGCQQARQVSLARARGPGEDREFTLKMTVGCALALIGFGMYSAVRLRQSQTAAAAGAKRPPAEGAERASEKQPLLARSSSLHQPDAKAAAGRAAAGP